MTQTLASQHCIDHDDISAGLQCLPISLFVHALARVDSQKAGTYIATQTGAVQLLEKGHAFNIGAKNSSRFMGDQPKLWFDKFWTEQALISAELQGLLMSCQLVCEGVSPDLLNERAISWFRYVRSVHSPECQKSSH